MIADTDDLFVLLDQCISEDPHIHNKARQHFWDIFHQDIYNWTKWRIRKSAKRQGRVLSREELEEEAAEFIYYIFVNGRIFVRAAGWRNEGGCPFPAYLRTQALRGLYRDWWRSRLPKYKYDPWPVSIDRQLDPDNDFTLKDLLPAPQQEEEDEETPDVQVRAEIEKTTQAPPLTQSSVKSSIAPDDIDEATAFINYLLAPFSPYERLLLELRVLYWRYPSAESVAALAEETNQSIDAAIDAINDLLLDLTLSKDGDLSDLLEKLAVETSIILQLQDKRRGIQRKGQYKDKGQESGENAEADLQESLVGLEKDLTRFEERRVGTCEALQSKKLRPSVKDLAVLLRKKPGTIEPRLKRVKERLFVRLEELLENPEEGQPRPSRRLTRAFQEFTQGKPQKGKK